jgi:uncharacterized protein
MDRRGRRGPAVSSVHGAVEIWFELGVQAARSGQRAWARDLFRRVVEADAENYQAWLWLASVTEGEERRDCVTRMQALVADQEGLTAGAAGAQRPRLRAKSALVGLLERFGPTVAAATILGVVFAAELATSLLDVRAGLVLHGALLIVLLLQVARADESGLRTLFLGLTLVPIVRIVSLSLPLAQYPVLYWYLIVSVPLFAAVWTAARSLGYSWRDLGLTLRGWRWQLLVALSSLALGPAQYLILRPEPLAPAWRWAAVWQPALILLLCTGLLEEMIYRGVLQRSAEQALGRWGMPFVALLFTAMHMGHGSVLNVAFALAVGLFFGTVVQRSRSLLGVALAHGLTNIVVFLVMPFLLR